MDRKWTPEKVLEAIRERQQKGLSLRSVWRQEPDLYASAKHHYGGWRKALMAAGIATRPLRRWTMHEVIEAIHARQQQGLPMLPTTSIDRSLYRAAKSRFGSWRKALVAVGLDPPALKSWTKGSVIAAIRQRYERGLPVKGVIVLDKPLYTAAYRRFGSWADALAAAGLESKPMRRWSKQRIIKEISTLYRNRTTNIRRMDNPLSGAVRRYFGSLHQAQEEAGLERPGRKWSPQRVINVLQNRRVRGLPIQSACWRKNLSLAQAAQRYFGNWENALVAAGLLLDSERPPKKHSWTPDKVIRAILARHEAGLPLRGIRNHDNPLFFAAAKHFGGWHKALHAAGLESNPRRRWSKQKIIKEILARIKQGLPMTSVWKYDCRLGAAARMHFGGWRDALLAAGYQIVHRNQLQKCDPKNSPKIIRS